MRNCFNSILVVISVCDSLHLVFAILDALRNSFGSLYPVLLLKVFPYLHYPAYRYHLSSFVCALPFNVGRCSLRTFCFNFVKLHSDLADQTQL